MSVEEIKGEIARLTALLVALVTNQPISMNGQKIYQEAVLSLGKHMTLNEAVPAEVGCAEAVSAVLSLAGIYDGVHGIAGTASLYEWLDTSPLFTKIDLPEEGAIIISPTGQGNGSIEGHTGIIGVFGKTFANDWGICSNDSASGKFLETWNYTRWDAYYGVAGDLPVYLFKAI